MSMLPICSSIGRENKELGAVSRSREPRQLRCRWPFGRRSGRWDVPESFSPRYLSAMKLPRHASITLSVDTSVTRREESWQQIFYIFRRAMEGKPFAESEIEYYGIGFQAREATSGEFPSAK